MITPEEWDRLWEAADECFRDVLLAFRETGVRPEVICSVTAAMAKLERKRRIIPSHKTEGKTGRAYIVVLNAKMMELTCRLSTAHPEGHLFRNSDGEPWTPNAIQNRVRRLRRKLGLSEKIVPYSTRHTFITTAQARRRERLDRRTGEPQGYADDRPALQPLGSDAEGGPGRDGSGYSSSRRRCLKPAAGRRCRVALDAMRFSGPRPSGALSSALQSRRQRTRNSSRSVGSMRMMPRPVPMR